MNIPIAKNKNWRFLLRDITSAFSFLKPASAAQLQYALTPVVSLAWLIHMHYPELAERDKLKILLPGVGFPECADEGRWMQFLPWLLGMPANAIDITLLGDELDEPKVSSLEMGYAALKRSWETPLHAAVKNVPVTQILNKRLSHCLPLTPETTPDVLVLFQPGFEEHFESWLTEDALLPFLRAGVPVLGSSYSTMDFYADKYILKVCGVPFGANTLRETQNPWRTEHEASAFVGTFAGCGWQLKVDALPEKLVFDEDAIHEYMEAGRYLRSEFKHVGDVLLEKLGCDWKVQDPYDGKEKTVYYLLDDLFVFAGSGDIAELTEDEQGLDLLDLNDRVPDSFLEAWPKEPGAERLIWAVSLHRDVVRPLLAENDTDDLLDFLGESEEAQKFKALMSQLGGDPHRTTQKATAGSGAFFNALQNQDWGQAQKLVEQKTSLLEATDGQGKSGGILAYAKGQIHLVHHWISFGLGLNLADNEGFTLAHDVVQRDDVQTLTLLLNKGIDTSARSLSGFTISAAALTRQSWKCVKLLIERGADITTPSLVGVCVKDAAAHYGAPPEVLKALELRLAKEHH